MGKLKSFAITIRKNPQAVYYAGQVMEGCVIVELNAPMKMRGIYLNLRGKGYVHWSESDGETSTNYSATEIYFAHKFACYGKPDPSMGGDNPELTAGYHVFPFTYQLPTYLPSSFEGEWGHVRYIMEANIDKPWKFGHSTQKMFTVVCLLDLNQEPNAALPAQGNNSKMLCCLCCESGPITASVSLDRRGYVPGEAITLNAEVYNGSSSDMDLSCVKIIMFQSFHSTTKSRTERIKLISLEKGDIPAGETCYWNQKRILMPPAPPSYLRHCKIIDIKHVLEFKVYPSGPLVTLDLIIGTIPLHQVVAQPPGMRGFSALPQPFHSPFHPTVQSADAQPNQPRMPPPSPPLLPPSYGECVFDEVNTRDEDDTEHTVGDKEYEREKHHQTTFDLDMTKSPAK